MFCRQQFITMKNKGGRAYSTAVFTLMARVRCYIQILPITVTLNLYYQAFKNTLRCGLHGGKDREAFISLLFISISCNFVIFNPIKPG